MQSLKGYVDTRASTINGREVGRVFCLPLGPLAFSSFQHRRTPELVLQKDYASFRITSGPPVQRIAVEPAKG